MGCGGYIHDVLRGWTRWFSRVPGVTCVLAAWHPLHCSHGQAVIPQGESSTQRLQLCLPPAPTLLSPVPPSCLLIPTSQHLVPAHTSRPPPPPLTPIRRRPCQDTKPWVAVKEDKDKCATLVATSECAGTAAGGRGRQNRGTGYLFPDPTKPRRPPACLASVFSGSGCARAGRARMQLTLVGAAAGAACSPQIYVSWHVGDGTHASNRCLPLLRSAQAWAWCGCCRH